MTKGQVSGAKLRATRLGQSVRQTDLARRCGISPSYLNLIEHDRRRVGAQLASKLAQALDVAPEALTLGPARRAVAVLDQAAADLGTPAGEAAGLVARYPQWAALIEAQTDQITALRDQVTALTDRLANDPHMASALHEVLSTVTSIRSTASILSKDSGLDADWQTRFHSNLYADSLRLSASVTALRETLQQELTGNLTAPMDEVDAALDAAQGHFPQIEAGDEPELPALSPPAARLIAPRLALYKEDAQALPLATFVDAARACAYDPIQLASDLDAPLARVLRRLASLPRGQGHPEHGMIVCDGGGVVLYRLALPDLALPRSAPLCPLWPLFTALATPGRPVCATVDMPSGETYACTATAETRLTGGLVLTQATVLIRAAPAAGDTLPVGPGCRICPRRACPARREPSVLPE